jgi:hypothetical protein
LPFEGCLQIVGALLILIPFGASQAGMRVDSHGYLWPNLVGSALLAFLALIHGQWGFLLLEGGWALVAARGLIVKVTRRETAPA